MLASHPVICFHGELGAGKTTFIKSICEGLGVTDSLSSPSFSIVNEYADRDGAALYHFDLYRLKQPEELLDIGWEDYLNSGRPLFIEWPELGDPYIPEDAVHIHVAVNESNDERTLTLSYLP